MTILLIQTTFDKSLHFRFFAANVIASRSKSIMLSETLDMREFSLVGFLFYSAYVHLQVGITVPQMVCYPFFANRYLRKSTAVISVFELQECVKHFWKGNSISFLKLCYTSLWLKNWPNASRFLRHTRAAAHSIWGVRGAPQEIGWHSVNFWATEMYHTVLERRLNFLFKNVWYILVAKKLSSRQPISWGILWHPPPWNLTFWKHLFNRWFGHFPTIFFNRIRCQ